MTFLIHFTVGDIVDAIVIEGETVEEIREKADAEISKRGGTHPWSEEI